jgi:hypothetical protein
MKALTDKFIDELEIEHDNKICREDGYLEGINFAIGLIERLEKEADFEEVGRVMMKHLGQGDKYHPHITVITTNSTCELVEGLRSVGQVMDYVPD